MTGMLLCSWLCLSSCKSEKLKKVWEDFLGNLFLLFEGCALLFLSKNSDVTSYCDS